MPSDQIEKRGGARPGAGRKPRPTERKLVRLTTEESAAVAEHAKNDGITVHAWMVRVIRKALETLNFKGA